MADRFLTGVFSILCLGTILTNGSFPTAPSPAQTDALHSFCLLELHLELGIHQVELDDLCGCLPTQDIVIP